MAAGGFLSDFQPLSPRVHCCSGERRGIVPRRGSSWLENGRRLRQPSHHEFITKQRQTCEQRCRASAKCSHYSYDGAAHRCALCSGCTLTDSATHDSWRRMGAVAGAAMLRLVENASHGFWGACRYDADAKAAPSGGHCTFKTEVEASLSVAGSAWEFYHFLIDLAPRLLFASFAGLWDSPHRASHAERRALELHRAIAALYDCADVLAAASQP